MTPADPSPAIDQARLLAEIESDTRLLRREGVITPAFERQLDALFDRVAPPATSDDLEQVVTSAEVLSFVNADVTIVSEKTGGGPVKHTVRRLVYWYVNYITDQVQAFAVVASRGLRLLGRRVERLEGAVPILDARVAAELDRTPRALDGSSWCEAIVAAVVGAPGRVVHAECDDGVLVRALAAGGLDAYGVEPRLTEADAASEAGIEVRDGDALAHLRLVPDGVLGGVVLSGCVDRYPLPWLLALVDEATRALAPDGRAVILTATPETWGTGASRVAADLAPGRPLHAVTWEHLFETRGYEAIATTAGPPDAEPASVLVTARRPGR
jgi:SAM-dependent methyltransferase